MNYAKVSRFNLMATCSRFRVQRTTQPGRGSATIRIKARDIRKGNTLDMTFISGDRVLGYSARITTMFSIFYRDDNFFYFMDMETFEQPAIPNELAEDYAAS